MDVCCGRGSQPSTVAQNSTEYDGETIACHHSTLESINRTLRAFHEIEGIAHENSTTIQDETAFETNYKQTIERNPDGRYVVALPFRSNSRPLMGNSRDIAISRLFQTERRFARDAKYRRRYIDGIGQLMKNGIMRAASSPVNHHSIIQANGEVLYSCSYLPHHGVVKESSTTTKLRTVFDASCKSGNGKSLNDTILIGSTIQATLFTLLLRWRTYPIVIKADIAQMYVQVLVNDEDANYQRIVWRSDESQPIRDYTLNTVTFGTASAPFLAIRTLHQLADDERKKFPTGARILKNDFYVDDLMSGAQTVEEAKTAQQQIIGILNSGGFKIRKWASNAAEIENNDKMDDREICESTIDTIKTLGLNWNPVKDRFLIKTNFIGIEVNSKRTLLSAASRLFDPLGWVAPCVIIAKILLQKLWLARWLSWDEPLPVSIKKAWSTFESNLVTLEQVSLPRWIGTHHSSAAKRELHGFSGATERAYAAVVYLRSELPDGTYTIHLLAAKSRVAPVKKVTLPRLELCGAVLVSKLAAQIQGILKINEVHLWSDSQIALAWIRGDPSRWKSFVANRVAEILTIISAAWRYVPSKDNPADCASRGLQPSELPKFELWWSGPTWLEHNSSKWPTIATFNVPEIEAETRSTQALTTTTIKNDTWTHLLHECSTYNRLLRVTATCIRWKRIIKKEALSKWISANEFESAQNVWIQHVQMITFANEIVDLKSHRHINRKSSIIRLNAFIDDKDILRVGGRLHKTDMPYNERHPIILPKKGRYIEMLIDQAHDKTMHGEATLVASYIRKRYWIIDARNAIRARIYKCVTCFRYTNHGLTQLMGDLPEPRVSISQPFTHTGVDYAGPLDILTRRGFGRRQITKGYICLFTCLVTKAIHLEAVGDMDTITFLLALNRFSSRRGKPNVIHSDCGTNLVGAARQLEKEFEKTIRKNERYIAEQLGNYGVQWKFIPPSSPHFGGLWEAGMKSTKYHLKRILGNSVLTFKEMSTTLAQIEGYLNSRPLCPMTSDPTDLTALTPAHFLVGDTIASIAKPIVAE